jgi:hypothetical protein
LLLNLTTNRIGNDLSYSIIDNTSINVTNREDNGSISQTEHKDWWLSEDIHILLTVDITKKKIVSLEVTGKEVNQGSSELRLLVNKTIENNDVKGE